MDNHVSCLWERKIIYYFSKKIQFYFHFCRNFHILGCNQTNTIMSLFKNIFLTIDSSTSIDFKHLAMVRRAKMIREGFSVDCINWDLYAKVLEAKHERLKMK